MASERLQVNEIFYSIQGESTYAGRPCVFIRLTGCNLRCSYCDTEYAFYEGRKMTADEILEQVAAYRCQLVEVTGGEPLLQTAVYPLIDRLLAGGHTVLIETSGAADISRLDPRVIKVMDFKCPASGEADRNLWSNLDHLVPQDEIKFVVSDRSDYEWARGIIAKHKLDSRVRAILLSCAYDRLEPASLASWILQDRLPVRLQLQLHKHIWPPDARGV